VVGLTLSAGHVQIFLGARGLSFQGEVGRALLLSSIWALLLGRALDSFPYLFDGALM
jgi:hypothetical protein